MTGSHELYRITTHGIRINPSSIDDNANPATPTNIVAFSNETEPARSNIAYHTDFYEFYWADLIQANTLWQFIDWFRFVLMRLHIHQNIRYVWASMWMVTIFFCVLWIWKFSTDAVEKLPNLLSVIKNKIYFPEEILAIIIVCSLLYPLSFHFILSYLGDVARYTRATPANISARSSIRDRGLKLLRNIHDSGDYDRIIVV